MIINYEKLNKELSKLGIQNFLGSPEKELKSIEPSILNSIDSIELLKFQNLKIINAYIISVENHPDHKFTKLWLMKVNSEIGEIEMLCNLRTEISIDEMFQKHIMIVIGLPKRIIGNVESNAMFFRFVTRFQFI